MKILHVIPGIDDPTCGIAVAAKMIARQQTAEGHSVETVSHTAWTAVQIKNADEVWVHSMWTPGVMKAAWTVLCAGGRLVRMPHGCTDPVKMAHHWYKKRWVAPIERWLFRRADVLVGTIPEELEQIGAFVPRHRGEIVLRPLFGAKVSATPQDRARGASLRLLYVGRLHPLKGVEYLIRALDSRMSLSVVGKDEGEGAKLRSLAAASSACVEFKGVVSEEEKNAALEACDVLCLPTLSENFGLVVAEALERGKRVITTDGAPAWGEGLELRVGSGGVKSVGVGSEIWSGYGGQLIYLKGYRDGTDEERVELLKKAIERICK